MTSLSFLRQLLQDVRHQKLRTLLTLFGITWGTVSVALLVAFGEGLQKHIVQEPARPRREHRDRLALAHLAALSGLGKGRRIRVTEDDIEALRREIPEAEFSAEFERDKSAFRRERVRLTPEISANSPIFAVMRNIIPAAGGRYVNDLDLDRRRRVVFLGDKLKQDLFGDDDAVGKTLMIDNVPFLVIGVMERSSRTRATAAATRTRPSCPTPPSRASSPSATSSNFIFQAKDPKATPEVTRRVFEVLARRHNFDPTDKEAIGMWDTTEARSSSRSSSAPSAPSSGSSAPSR